MQWLKTFSLVIRSSVSGLCEQFENPERTIHQLILDMEDELQSIRCKVAGVLADEIQLEKKWKQAEDDAKQWQDRAASALQRGDETNARAALEQKLFARDRADALGSELKKHRDESAKLQHAVRDLESKIRQARHRKALLAARLARAESSRVIHGVVERCEGHSALAQFRRLEERVDRAEALDEAHQRLDGHDPAAADLERRFAEREQREKLKKEFEDLKSRLKPQS